MDSSSVPIVWVGDWVVRKDDSEFFGGRVKAVYQDPTKEQGKFLIDLSVYAMDGNRTGRVSPVCGGPKSFEPALALDEFERIARPEFPIETKLVWSQDPQRPGQKMGRYDFRPSLEFLLARTSLRAKPVKASVSLPAPVNIRALLDPPALRLAAQSIRDAANALPAEHRSALIAEAVSLEKQADDLRSPMRT